MNDEQFTRQDEDEAVGIVVGGLVLIALLVGAALVVAGLATLLLLWLTGSL